MNKIGANPYPEITKHDILLGGWERSVLRDILTGGDIGIVPREWADMIVDALNNGYQKGYEAGYKAKCIEGMVICDHAGDCTSTKDCEHIKGHYPSYHINCNITNCNHRNIKVGCIPVAEYNERE